MNDQKAISIWAGPSITKLSLRGTSLVLEESGNAKASYKEIPQRNVLHASFDRETWVVNVTYLYKAKKKQPFHLIVAEGKVEEEKNHKAAVWVDALMSAAYAGVPRSRRLLIFVNPHGGKKQGVALFSKKIHPIFTAAGCSMEIIHTTGPKHAYNVVKSIQLVYDAIITVSGDGLIHEVLNGFAHHVNPLNAFATPVAPIPTGTGNALSINLLGIEDGFDVCAAALNVVKGLPMKVDLFSFSQGEKRVISFMSQSLGLMADLDLGTENLRWMGDSRFFYGFVKGLIQFKTCPVQVSYKLAEKDKQRMAEVAHARTKELASKYQLLQPISAPEEHHTSSLPPLKHLTIDEDAWTTFDDPILYVYAGKGPYVGRDLMAFPVSLPDDGLIDIAIMSSSSRSDVIGAIDGAKEGANYWYSKIEYMKAHAYRIKPLKKKGYLSIDGEPYPFEEYQVEVHSALGTFLSLYGHYVSSFELRAPQKTS